EAAAIGGEPDAGDRPGVWRRTRVVERIEVVMALALQVAPFPAAQPGRAVVEQPIDAVDVVGRPLAFGKGHPVEVEETLGPLLLELGRPHLAFESALITMAGPQADNRQQGAGPHQAEGRLGGAPLGPAEAPLPPADPTRPHGLALEEVAEVVGQLAGRGVAKARLPDHGLQADALEVGRDPGIARSGPRRLAMHDIVQD